MNLAAIVLTADNFQASFVDPLTSNSMDSLKPGSHMSPMIGKSLAVIIQGENSQRILLMSNHRQ